MAKLSSSKRNTISEIHVSQTTAQCSRQVFFDLSIYGHHPAYIRHLILYWQCQQISGTLTFVVLPDFLHVHADVVSLASEVSSIYFVPIRLSEAAALKNRSTSLNRNLRNFQEWRLFQHYAHRLHADHCLILYFDTCIVPAAVGKSFPCPFSGIYFRPTFHYSIFQPNSVSRSSFKTKLQNWREQFLLKRLLSHPKLQTLFSLDQMAVDALQQLWPSANITGLPDPVDIRTTAAETCSLRQKLGIENGRKVFLLFGAITQRKGGFKLLEAITTLPTEHCKQLCIAFIGEANPTIQALLQERIKAIQQTHAVQFVCNFEYVDETRVPKYFQLADVVLAPYQQHVGMSGILLQAAAAKKPVLSSDYGLMGEVTKRHKLGLAVDSAQPRAIALGISRLLSGDISDIYSPLSALDFAKSNSSERFSEVIWSEILSHA